MTTLPMFPMKWPTLEAVVYAFAAAYITILVSGPIIAYLFTYFEPDT